MLVKYHTCNMYLTDDDLIQACRKGDSHAWEIVVDKYKRLVFSIPLNYGLSREDAADITQITFTILFESLDQLYPNARLAPWLSTVARRHSWRMLERYRREHTNDDEALEHNLTNSIDHAGYDDLERGEKLAWLDKGFAQLDERCARLLLLLYFSPNKPSYAEVAAELNMPVSSVSPIRARCLKKLKKVLGKRP